MESSVCILNKRVKHKLVNLKQVMFFFAGTRTEHVAHPVGEARILVIEIEDSE